MRDLLLERITATVEHDEIGSIPFPDGLAPVPCRDFAPAKGAAMPHADVAVITYTTAEAEALADVLTPGVHHTDWIAYTRNWPEFEKQLTGRSPARDSKCMAQYWPTTIGDKRVLAIKSELHLATDGESLPVAELVKQIVADAGCSLVITTGTAGGVGASEVLGDVVFSAGVKMNMAKSQFEGEPWAEQRFAATHAVQRNVRVVVARPTLLDQAFDTLIPAAIGDALKPSGYADRAPEAIFGKDVETVGYFAFADTADSYGVVANDPNAGVEEMDDGAVALALDYEGAPQWLAVRNASDPQMGGGSLAEQAKQAAAIYSKYGYFTTVCSALACWAVIAGLGGLEAKETR